METKNRHWMVRVVSPGVPWWIALPCNALAAAAIVLLVIDPDKNLSAALMLLLPASITLYGTAMIRWWRNESKG